MSYADGPRRWKKKPKTTAPPAKKVEPTKNDPNDPELLDLLSQLAVTDEDKAMIEARKAQVAAKEASKQQ